MWWMGMCTSMLLLFLNTQAVGRQLEELEAGVRLSVDERKRHPWILLCGKPPNPGNLLGTAPGVKGVPDDRMLRPCL